MNLDSHNSASRHVLGHVKAWEGGGGHSEGICRGPGTESKCERQKTQRSGGRNCHKVKKQKKTVNNPVAGMQRYYCRLTLVIAVGHSTPPNTLYHSLVVVLCMGMSL